MAKSETHLCFLPCQCLPPHFVSKRYIAGIKETAQNCNHKDWQNYLHFSVVSQFITHSLPYSSLVMSELPWQHPEELKFEAKRYFCCINLDRITMQSLQKAIFTHFLIVRLICVFARCPLKTGTVHGFSRQNFEN